MVLAAWRSTIVDDNGNIVPNAQVEVKFETVGQPLATLFSNRDGTIGLGNPFLVDSEGFAEFFAIGSAYQIRAFVPATNFERIWRYVGVGRLQEKDVSGEETTFATSFSLTGSITPPSVSADQNNYNPNSLSAATVINVEPTVNDIQITGLAGGVDGKMIIIVNIASSFRFIIPHEHASSTAANRFSTGAASDISLRAGAAAWFRYNGALQRWKHIEATPTNLAAWLRISATATIAQITSNQNNYNPGSLLKTQSVFKISTDATRNITGLDISAVPVGQTNGKIAVFTNVGTQAAVFKHEDAGSNAENRLKINADVTIAADESLILQYQDSTLRWHKIATAVAAGAAAPVGAQYIVVALDGTLTSERRLQVGAGLSMVDGGANGDITLDYPFRVVKKPADQQISSDATVNNDTALSFAVEANQTYKARLVLHTTSGATPDFKCTFSGPAAATLVRFSSWAADDVSASDFATSNGFGTESTTTYSAANVDLMVEFVLQNGANAGTVNFQWSQATSSATTTTVHGGSYLEWMKVT